MIKPLFCAHAMWSEPRVVKVASVPDMYYPWRVTRASRCEGCGSFLLQTLRAFDKPRDVDANTQYEVRLLAD